MARMTVHEGTRVGYEKPKGRATRPPDAHPNPTGGPNGRLPAGGQPPKPPRPEKLIPGGTRMNPNVGADGEDITIKPGFVPAKRGR